MGGEDLTAIALKSMNEGEYFEQLDQTLISKDIQNEDSNTPYHSLSTT